MNEISGQIKCLECGQNKGIYQKDLLVYMGIGLMTMIPFILIALGIVIPLFFLFIPFCFMGGIVILVSGLIVPRKEVVCLNCQNKWEPKLKKI